MTGYVRSLNEEQVRLAAGRVEGRPTGWVWVALVRRPVLADGAGI